MRPKVAILGGGVAGLAAAYALTDPESGIDADVAVYQLGWRLGGKGASGRNAAQAMRIEEHGLHLWFGFYRNAFRMMRDAYNALPHDPKRPLRSVETAFEACDTLTLWDEIRGRPHPHRIPLPLQAGEPWDDEQSMPDFWHIVRDAAERALQLWPQELEWEGEDAHVVLREVMEFADGQIDHGESFGAHDWLLGRLRRLRDVLKARYQDELASNPRARLVFTTIDTFVAMAVGIVRDVLVDERGFDAVDHWDWTAWLRRHGASPVHTAPETFARRAPLLRAVYDVAFCFPGGDVEAASAAAGTATNNLLRMLFGYRGGLMYRMRAGMGDAVATPLYEVLSQRGVAFRFFHAVTGLGVSRGRVDAIRVVEQARGFASYAPLVDVGGLPCWPSQPRWSELDPADAGVDYEADLNPKLRPERVLREGADFDQVVLAIPVGAFPTIACELMAANPRFAAMVAGAQTVQTQAYQLWTVPRQAELGLPHGDGVVAAGHVEPLDTYCDMSHLLSCERWPGEGPRGILYGCGVLPDGEGIEAVRARVAIYLISHFREVWPQRASQGGELDWNVLHDPEGGVGEERLSRQYLRANTTPWERYVITPAGSVATRLRADESGFDNLVLAGDWTRNGIDGGCVEAAVTSGLQAARALGASPEIIGEGTTWLTAR